MMPHEPKKVFIAGGTGFIGYHAAKLFLSKNIEVGTIALPNEIELGDWYPKEVDLHFGNLFKMTQNDITDLLGNKNYDTFIYALGPDDRFVPDAPAYDFFHDRLVVQCEKICSAAKAAGIKRCVVLNSYFSHFDRLYNSQLSKHHPYILARVEQETTVIALEEPGFFDVMVLELPFIFGIMPNRKPLWRTHFLSFFDGMKSLQFPKGGGTAAISVEGVAEAIVACAYHGESGVTYPIGLVNLTYRHLIETMMSTIGDNRKYQPVSPFLAALFAGKIDREYKALGKENGLDHKRLMLDVLSRKFYIDPDFMMERLGFAELGFQGGKNIYISIEETLRDCYPERFN